MLACNGWDRGSRFAPTRKRADFHLVFDRVKAGKTARKNADVTSLLLPG